MIMRTQPCREAMEKVADLCGITPEVMKRTDPITQLCKIKGNEPLSQCATDALLPLLSIKDTKVKNAVIRDIKQKLLQRDKKTGEFIKDRLTLREVEEIIVKYLPSYKTKSMSLENQSRYRLNKQHQGIIKKVISLQYAHDEREALSLIFKWAAERIAKQK